MIDARVTAHRLPLVSPLRTARGVVEERRIFLLSLTDEDGRVGWGEAAPLLIAGTEGSEATGRALGRLPGLLGLGSLSLEAPGAWEEALLGAMPGEPAARHAVDVALWDLLAQRRGQPLAQLLTDHPRREVLANALIGGEDVAESARRAVGEGFTLLKLKVGARPLDEDRARVDAARGVLPSRGQLRLDANGAWPGAVAAAAGLEALGAAAIDSVEQPVPARNTTALRWLRARSAAAIAADEAVLDESTGLRLIELGAADALVLKPMKLGGLSPCLRLARAAVDAGLRCWVTTTIDGAVARAAATHLASAMPGPPEHHGLATAALLGADVGSGLTATGGSFQLDFQTSGHGIRP